VFDPIDGTTNFAHGLPIFCLLALEVNGEAQIVGGSRPHPEGTVHGRADRGAFLNGADAVSSQETLLESVLVTGFPTMCIHASLRSSALRRVRGRAVRCAGSVRRRSTPAMWLRAG
jgi:fructose-1,6-bisphosphatase/inositol monophosphatase family enzyme